ncbi:MAG: TolC family protein [Candidatus Latescibacteria bacterium]|jgi:outer membrane protein TolC|nr:TolC family protein [Candidatus Latescibacterota bacterium]
MNHMRGYFITLLLVIIFSNITYCLAEEQSIELSLQDCIDRALKENLNLKSSYLGLRAEDFSIIQAESQFDPFLSLSMNRRQSETPTYLDYYNVKSIESKISQLDLTLSQTLSTGANWGFGFYNTLSESNIETAKNYSSNLGISVSQPLLKGFGKKINRSNIFIARLTKESTLYDLENNAITLVNEVQKAYWNLAYALESLKVRELSIDQADSLLAYNRKGLELGVLTESDVLEAESTLLSRQQDVLFQKGQIRAAEDVLIRLLNLISGEGWRLKIVPTDIASVTDIDIDPEDAFRNAVKLRPEYKIILKNLEQYDIYQALAKNNMSPSLDLTARYNINGSGKNYSKDLRDMGGFDQYGWNLGLLFSYPLKNRNAKADYEKRQIDIKRANLALEDIESMFMAEIRTGIRNVEISREMINVAKLSVEVNELRLKKEEERFRNQLSTSYFVLQFQTDLVDSRNRYNKTIIDYIIAVAELRKARGTLLRDFDISIIPIVN